MDFCQTLEPQWKQQLLGFGLKLRNRPQSLSLSEIMTILLAFQQSCCRNFKTYYQAKVQREWADAFPGIVSYQRFIEWVPSTLSADVRLSAIVDQLKNLAQIEHSRHRSPVNCFVNILGGLIAYCHQPKKPAIAIDRKLLLPT